MLCWPPSGPCQCDFTFIISSRHLPFLCHLSAPYGTFSCHMASYILPPYAQHSLNPLFIQFDDFPLLLDFWSLLSSQVSLPSPVHSYFMSVYTIKIATYVCNSFTVLGTFITLLTSHKICTEVTYFRRREDTSIQKELTLFHRLIWGPINLLQSSIIWTYKESRDKRFSLNF